MQPSPPPEPAEVLPGLPPPTVPRPRWIAYVDLDAFYVSCELRDRPELRGRAVIVGPPPAHGPSRGVVLSASYEARAFGVRSALPAAIAARMCPEATWIAPDFAKYERVSGEVRELLRRQSDTVIPFSIDEAAVVLEVDDPERARAAAEEIQRELRRALDLPASIGVATTRLVAKIATDSAKPAGIRVVPPGAVAEFVAPLPVRAVPGVGPKTDEILRLHGITTIGELASHRGSEIAEWLGDFGRELVLLARGTPSESAETESSGPRSRSTDRTFARDVTNWEEIAPAVSELARSLSASLEREGLLYAGVGVGFRWADFSRSQRSRALTAAREGVAPLEETALRLARELWEAEPPGRRRPIRTISLRTERLSERTQHQASLDDFPPAASPARKPK